jgi:excisionase family DNA binding protein
MDKMQDSNSKALSFTSQRVLQAPQISVRRFLTTAELSKRLRVSSRTIRLWAECGELPAHKLGRQWRFDTESIAIWITRRDNSA